MSDHLQEYKCRVRPRGAPEKIATITVKAENLEEAVSKLLRDGSVVISVGELTTGFGKVPAFFGLALLKKPTGTGAQAARFKVPKRALSAGARKKKRLQLFPQVGSRELISFAVQLSALLQAGVPLLRSFDIIVRGTQNSYFQSILESCIQSLSGGFSLSSAISSYPKVFPPVWLNLIKVGEKTGTLPDVLREIAHYQEAAQRVKSKVISAFFYPSILILFATCAVGFLLLKIIPQFEEIFRGLKIELPVITQVVLFASHIIRHYFIGVVLVVVLLISAFLLAIRKPAGRFLFDLIRLKSPIMGTLILEVSIVRFTRGLSALVRAGAPILEALDISARLAANAVVEKVLMETQEAVRGGHGLGAHIESSNLFPVFMTQLISIGEESGELGQFLNMIANYYEERIDTFLARLTTLMEPLLLIFVGSIIGVLVVSMMLPIIEISTSAHG